MEGRHLRKFVVVAALIACLIAVPSPAVGASDINLLGPNGNATIVLHGDFTGVIGTGVTNPLAGIYNPSPHTESLTPIGPGGVDCGTVIWRWDQIFCDPPPTTDNASTVTKLNRNVGITFNNDYEEDWYGYYVVDLGSVYSLGDLQVFQMFSDGKVTHVSLEGHPQTGATRPSITDSGWLPVLAKSLVNAGTEELGPPDRITNPTSFSLGGVSTRYVLLKFWNDGRFGFSGYIEVGGLKLFGVGGAVPGSPSLQPETFELALTPTDGTVCASTSQSGLAGIWMTLPGTNDCTPPASKPDAKLLGWATSPDFPVAIAKRQIDNGWGVYETFNVDGQPTGVFIPAGGSTLVSASGRLYAIWSE